MWWGPQEVCPEKKQYMKEGTTRSISATTETTVHMIMEVLTKSILFPIALSHCRPVPSHLYRLVSTLLLDARRGRLILIKICTTRLRQSRLYKEVGTNKRMLANCRLFRPWVQRWAHNIYNIIPKAHTIILLLQLLLLVLL